LSIDPYQVLGVGRDATEQEIRRAFRRLAKRYHPDLNVGDPAAEQRFKDVLEAFRNLRDGTRAPSNAAPSDGAAAAMRAGNTHPPRQAYGFPHRAGGQDRVIRPRHVFVVLAVTAVGLLSLVYFIWANTNTDWIPGCCFTP
jgi:hypothetical protein